MQGVQGSDLGEARLTAIGNYFCTVPTTGNLAAQEQPSSLRANVQLEQNHLSMASSGYLEINTRKKIRCQHPSSFFSNLRIKESQIGAWIHFSVFNKPLMYFSSMNLSNCFLNPFIFWAVSSVFWLCFLCGKGLCFVCSSLWPDHFIQCLLFLPYKKQWIIVYSHFLHAI